MKRNVLILEDRESHMRALHKILDEVPGVEVFEAYNMTEAYYVLSLNCIHLFLVDIVLETSDKSDVSGLNFVRELRNNKNYRFAPVIFVTSLEDPKLLSYSQLHCYGYIEKPFDSKLVKEIVCEALQFPASVEDDKNIYFRKDGIIYSVNTKDIIYIDTQYRKLVIHTVNDQLTISYKTLAEVVKELDDRVFVKCSKNTVINLNYIEYIDNVNRYIKLRGIDERVEIGRAFTKELKEVFEND